MKRIISLIFILITILAGCTGTIPPPSPTTATAQATNAVPTLEEGTGNDYDPNPEHIWNRVFRQFYKRTAKDGTEYGLGELDPLLWFDTTYLLTGSSHQQAIQVLDEFLTTHAENLIDDPLKRAMFQRDLWAVFDWLASNPALYPSQRAALKMLLAQIIQRVALTREQITSLPDNYALAIQSGAFPATFQEDNPEAAFLPADLFQFDSAWVPMGREGGPIAMTHTEGFPFFGRSVFLVFIRSPDGREATLNFIHSLNTERRPALATDSGVALVRRMLLIDGQGSLVLSPLVETVQIRHFSPVQSFHEFELKRDALFAQSPGGLDQKTVVIPLFMSHGDVFEFHDIPSLKATIPDKCRPCHVNIPAVLDRGTIQGIISYSRASFPLSDNQQPILFATTWADEAQTVIDWKLNHHTWKRLKYLWNR